MENIMKDKDCLERSSETIMPELFAGGASCSENEVGSDLSAIDELGLTEEEERALLQDSNEEEMMVNPMEGPVVDAITTKEEARTGVSSMNIPAVREGIGNAEQSRESLIANDVAAINCSKVGKKVSRNKWKEKAKTLERELAKSGALNLKLQEECKKLRAEKKYLKTKVKTVKIQKRIKKLEARCDTGGERKEREAKIERQVMENNQWRTERSVRVGFQELYPGN